MLRAAIFVAILVASANAHLFLLDPVNRGGSGNNGGTTGPCNNLKVFSKFR